MVDLSDKKSSAPPEDFGILIRKTSPQPDFKEDLTVILDQQIVMEDAADIDRGYFEDLTIDYSDEGSSLGLAGQQTRNAGTLYDERMYEELMKISIETNPDADPILFAETVLIGLAGSEQQIDLARPFSPTEEFLSLLDRRDASLSTMNLNQLDYLCLASFPKQFAGKDMETITEMVETVGGKSEKVEIPVEQNFETGFLCRSAKLTGRFKYFFFPFNSIKTRYQTSPIGEILLRSGMITKPVLEDVLIRYNRIKKLKLGQILAQRANVNHTIIEKTLINTWKKHQNIDNRIFAGDILVQAGLVTSKQVKEAIKVQEIIQKKRIGDVFIEQGHISEQQLYIALADKFRRRFVDLAETNYSGVPDTALPRDLALQLKVLPLAIEKERLILATSQPETPVIYDILKENLHRLFELRVATPSQLQAALTERYMK